MSSAIIIIEAGTGFIRYVNSSFEEDTGYARAEVFGKHYQQYLQSPREEDVFESIFATVALKNVWAGRITNVRKTTASMRPSHP